MNYEMKHDKILNEDAVYELYADVGWVLYTRDMKSLMLAIKNSLDVLTLWDLDTLIGLIRVVGDGHSILYIQDILIMKDYQREGLGTYLLNQMLSKYAHVRMKVLLTDQQEKTKLFYESIGFSTAGKLETVCFVKHDK